MPATAHRQFSTGDAQAVEKPAGVGRTTIGQSAATLRQRFQRQPSPHEFPGTALRVLTLGLTGTAAVTAQVALAEPGSSVLESVAPAAVVTLLTVGVHVWLSRCDMPAAPPRWFASLVALAVALPVGAWLVDPGPVERPLAESVALAMMLLAGGAHWHRTLHWSVLASLFLVVAACGRLDGPARWGLIVYAGLGTLWLLRATWPSVPGRLPWPTAAAVTVLVAAVMAGAAAVSPSEASAGLEAWLPSSGGWHSSDERADSGLGSGSDGVAGPNAVSAGFADSETVLESSLPSLTDALPPKYGAPKPEPASDRPSQERAFFDKFRSRHVHGGPAEQLQVGKQFTLRRSRPNPTRPADVDTDALMFVGGRVPLHLRLTAFDEFDGVRWTAGPRDRRFCRLKRDPGAPHQYWWRCPSVPPDLCLADTERHQIKVARLESGVLPLPAAYTRFRIVGLTIADGFGWEQPDVLRLLAGRKVPPTTFIEVDTGLPDAEKLGQFPRQPLTDATPKPEPGSWEPDPFRHQRLPQHLSPAIGQLAERWTRGVPEGWPQIEAVIAALRSGEFCVSDHFDLPQEHTDAVARFLFETRAGPDYCFASAAVVLLRWLGYEARLVSGFVARPEKYDSLTGHTPVHASDVHFWIEVRHPNSGWFALEPTPGYELLTPREPWWRRAWAASAGWLAEHAGILLMAILMVGAAAVYRRELRSRLALARWRIRMLLAGSVAEQVAATLELIETQAKLASVPRLPHQTWRRWRRQFGPLCDDWRLALSLAEGRFGSGTVTPADPQTVTATLAKLVSSFARMSTRAATANNS